MTTSCSGAADGSSQDRLHRALYLSPTMPRGSSGGDDDLDDASNICHSFLESHGNLRMSPFNDGDMFDARHSRSSMPHHSGACCTELQYNYGGFSILGNS